MRHLYSAPSKFYRLGFAMLVPFINCYPHMTDRSERESWTILWITSDCLSKQFGRLKQSFFRELKQAR